MLEYHAAYYRDAADDTWISVEVLDFPGVVTQGRTLDKARRMLRDALGMMADYFLETGKPLPRPDPRVSDPEAFLIEPVYLGVRVRTVTAPAPQATAQAAS